MTPHSSTLAWIIPWTAKSGRLQSMGSLRVRHDWATSLSLFTFMHWRRKWQPTPVFLPGESQGRGSLVDCRLWGRTESIQLKQLSSSLELEISLWEKNAENLCWQLDRPGWELVFAKCERVWNRNFVYGTGAGKNAFSWRHTPWTLVQASSPVPG